ncbi:MAG: outer membrane beta-barrel protein [Saprospiraceae bacterium]|nr:outer membrane beta-barrel protein [Saprospiraceae bacterium]
MNKKGSTWYSRPGNFEEQKDFGFSISGTQLIMKGWNIQFYGAINNVSFKSKIYSENLDASRWYTIITPTNLFNFGKNWSGELAGSFQSKILSGQFTIDPIWSVRLGIAKKVLNQKGTLKLNISDIFYTNQVAGEIRNIKNATANWFSFLDSRIATISFSYQFNKGEKLKTRKVGGADLEKSRVKI